MAVQSIATTNSNLPKNLFQLVPTITSLLQRNLKPQENTNLKDSAFLNQFSSLLNPELVVQVIKNQTSPYHSLFFFDWAANLNPNPNNYSHSFHCYLAITDKLISHNLFSLATRLLESHNKICDFTVGKLINAHGDLGHLKWAVKLFRDIKRRESGYCLFSYNALLGVLIKGRRLQLAWGLFGQMIKEGVVKPDVSTYCIMIRGFCQAGMIDHAKKVFDEMGERNLFTYNIIVNGLCKKGLMEDARRVLDEMLQSGTCFPDAITYSTLIDGYCKKGEVAEAMRCFNEMSERKVYPNVLTYNGLINGLCLNGDVDGARKMMTKMRLSGLKDNIATHTSLLKGYCKAGRSNEAIQHFKEMIGLGMELDEKCYAVIIKEYAKLRLPDEAIALLREMRVKGMSPVVYSFNAVLRCLLDMDELDRALILLKQMPEMGSYPNFISYSTMICGLVKVKGRMQDIEMLLNDMLQSRNRLDATLYNCLIEGYCKDRNEERALQVCQEMIDQNFVISVEVFEVFVKELFAKGKLFEAENLFEQMKSKRHIQNINSYKKILDECVG